MPDVQVCNYGYVISTSAIHSDPADRRLHMCIFVTYHCVSRHDIHQYSMSRSSSNATTSRRSECFRPQPAVRPTSPDEDADNVYSDPQGGPTVRRTEIWTYTWERADWEGVERLGGDDRRRVPYTHTHTHTHWHIGSRWQPARARTGVGASKRMRRRRTWRVDPEADETAEWSSPTGQNNDVFDMAASGCVAIFGSWQAASASASAWAWACYRVHSATDMIELARCFAPHPNHVSYTSTSDLFLKKQMFPGLKRRTW